MLLGFRHFSFLNMKIDVSKFIRALKFEFLMYKKAGLAPTGFKIIRRRILSCFGVLQLEQVFICPSHECNANCAHCYEKLPHHDSHKSLTNKEVKNIVDQSSRLGSKRVYLCSGEFLLREDALDLVRYARSKNMIVSVTTNGLLLNEKKIDELKEAGLTILIVSIDSANPSRHDELRGVKGCFEKARNGLRIAKEKGIITQIWTYITKTNFNELESIAKMGKELGVENVYVFFPLLSGHLFNRFDENLTYEERESFRKRFNGDPLVTLEFDKEETPCNGGGLLHACIMPTGDVTFCPPVPYSYGNIKSRSLRDCLKDVVKDHKKFSHCTGQCIVNFPEYRTGCNAKYMYSTDF
jgi:MoaA/NifB/PqqE/SkfB family radical SAM enzyme